MKVLIEHSVIGPVTISRTRRASRLTVSVRPDGAVRLSYPVHVTHKQALRFLDEKAVWVTESRRRMEERNPLPEPITAFRTRNHTLRLNPCPAERITVKIKGGEIAVSYPDALDAASDEVQQAVSKGIVEALRIEAKQTLPAATARLAALHGFRHGEVRVKASRSKWGSCTARNDINLSLFLMLLPDRLIEYIILHELCHTVHKNHSPRFHDLLDRVAGGQSSALNRELRSHRPDIRHTCGTNHR